MDTYDSTCSYVWTAFLPLTVMATKSYRTEVNKSKGEVGSGKVKEQVID